MLIPFGINRIINEIKIAFLQPEMIVEKRQNVLFKISIVATLQFIARG
ncbi:hypothetical protein N824_05175 [Pedobacter sp. V48]|nr:hypothetical protein N824_05175 [Pedobacter sp. V48]